VAAAFAIRARAADRRGVAQVLLTPVKERACDREIVVIADAGGGPCSGPRGPRRSLILAGGPLRAAYHAGALRALNDASLSFHHVDATSGGALTQAMWLSGQTPEEMCERWSTLPASDLVSLMPLPVLSSAWDLPSIGDAERIVDVVLPHLGVELARVRAAQDVAGTLNVANFTHKTLEVVPHGAVDLDWLVAAFSAPILMPPVRIGRHQYVDASWTKSANLLEAVKRGSDELWVIWYVTNSPGYAPGLVRQYGHLLELRANASLFEEFACIRAINARIEAGEIVHGHQRPIRVHMVKPVYPLPFEPEYYLGRMDAATLVALGYRDAQRYLGAVKPGGVPLTPDATAMIDPPPGLSFREALSGPFTLGVSQPEEGAARGDASGTRLTMNISGFIRNIAAFASGGAIAAELVGSIELPGLMQPALAAEGRLRLDTRPESSVPVGMLYELVFQHAGTTYCLAGRKDFAAGTGDDPWAEVTTLAVRLHVGHNASGAVVGAGVLRLGAPHLLRLISSLGAPGTQTVGDAKAAIDLFGRTCLRGLWDRYSRYAVAPPDSGSRAV
jgi:predicted acylesterase/phospholipase RssA